MSARAEHQDAGRRIAELFESSGLSFDLEAFAEALRLQLRKPGIVALPQEAQDFWDRHAGTPRSTPEEALATNAVALSISVSSALPSSEAAARLGIAESTVRSYRASGKLYSFSVLGRPHFPRWQFGSHGIIPSMKDVLEAMPAGLHPQSVEGFFLSPNSDLVLAGVPVSPKEWLESGADAAPVVEFAASLGRII
ncbi:hypothetical protein ACSYDW_14550 [Paeniglutamicibacter sp. R2-26]|uniref:hypothetical protein n=1 Tax=Paeniglutamicibacter sp. R2-26 TaxID=3144417 RepID=UPI003EE80613